MNTTPVLALAVAAALLGPEALIGQARPPTTPPAEGAPPSPSETRSGAEPDEPDLDREVFVYPGGDRRDPFRQLLPEDSTGPRFEELRLIGLIHSPDPRVSVALVALSTASAPAPTGIGEQIFRLRQDVVLGDVRVVRVEQEYLIVEVSRFGMEERLELHLDRQRRDER